MFCSCGDNQSVEIVGLCDTTKIDTTALAWTEISIPEVLKIPCQKPDVESIEKVLECVKIISKKLIATPDSGGFENSEGTKLTGQKLIVEGILQQKIVYTAEEPTQSVHSADFCVPFSAYIVVQPLTDPTKDYCVGVCVEDVFVKVLNEREIFKNVTLFLSARIITISC